MMYLHATIGWNWTSGSETTQVFIFNMAFGSYPRFLFNIVVATTWGVPLFLPYLTSLFIPHPGKIYACTLNGSDWLVLSTFHFLCTLAWYFTAHVRDFRFVPPTKSSFPVESWWSVPNLVKIGEKLQTVSSGTDRQTEKPISPLVLLSTAFCSTSNIVDNKHFWVEFMLVIALVGELSDFTSPQRSHHQ